MEEDNEDIPSPSSVASMQLNAGDSLAMIEAWMPPFREKSFTRICRRVLRNNGLLILDVYLAITGIRIDFIRKMKLCIFLSMKTLLIMREF